MSDEMRGGPIVVLWGSGRELETDSWSAAADHLIDGHATMSADDALAARFDVLVALAGAAQAGMVAELDIDQLPEPVVAAALTSKDVTLHLDGGWPDGFPLLLVASLYTPYTDVPVPAGDDVVLLDPHTERSFVEAFVTLGLAKVLTRS